jgi:glycine dehydrogenase subunit 2
VGVRQQLVDFLPGPVVSVVEEETEEDPPLYGLTMPAKSIQRVKAFQGHFGMHVRAYTYIRMQGKAGIRAIADHSVLNANYLRVGLRDTYPVPYDRICMHEFVAEGRLEGAPGVRALDIAKRLMDYGIHPPTNYFPLIVPEALMIEPTETEARAPDCFIDAMQRIAQERVTIQMLKTAPTKPPSDAWMRCRPPGSWCCAAGPWSWTRLSPAAAGVRGLRVPRLI